MSRQLAGSRQYYLGIAGEQTGPWTEDQVHEQIQKGLVPLDALIWFDGLSDWQSIQEIEFFRSSLNKGPDSLQSMPAPSATASPEPIQPKAKQSNRDRSRLRPVFSAEEGVFEKRSPLKSRLLTFAILGGLGCLFWFWNDISGLVQSELGLDLPIPQGAIPKKVVTEDERQTLLRKYSSELLDEPAKSTEGLLGLIKQNSKDEVAKEAYGTLLDIYRREQKFKRAGELSMIFGQFDQAVEYFSKEEGAWRELTQALKESYAIETDPKKKWDKGVRCIELYLNDPGSLPAAIEMVRLLNKDFPRTKNPYQYYISNTEQKLNMLFPRISFFYVQKLLNTLQAEFPEMGLTERPRIEIRKEAGSRFRLVGIYQGAILLNQDRLNDIRLKFWLWNDNWNLIETNLTAQRQRLALELQSQLKDKSFTTEEMLEHLETVFRAQFPKRKLHEDGALSQSSPSNEP